VSAVLAASNTGEAIGFWVLAPIAVIAALGMVLAKNAVHCALFLAGVMLSLAGLYALQDAPFLAAVQVIVYTGAIVVLILFVLMLLGVDTDDDIAIEPIVGQRILAVLAGLALLGALLAVFIAGQNEVVTGTHSATAAISDDLSNIAQLGRQIFTTWIFAFEITAGLLTVAVIGAVVMARRPDSFEPLPEPASMTDDGRYVDEPDS